MIVGVGGGEYGIRGFIAAYDATTGRRPGASTRFPRRVSPVPKRGSAVRPDSNGFCDPDAWKHGGGSIWMTGSYDPQLNLTYWGVGNVGPDYNGEQRPGDNLYTDSVVALDADTGKLKWHYQFTPHDVYDYDSVQVPVLVDNWAGSRVNVVTWANRNGNFYALDRETGRFLARQAVREGQLDERVRRARPSQADAAAGRTADLSGQSRRDELVLAVVQPAHRPVLRLRPGKTTRASMRRRRRSTRKARTSAAAARGICRRCRARPAWAGRRSTRGPRRPATAR